MTRCAEPYAEGDLVTIQLDMDAASRHVAFYKNGVLQGAGDGLPGGDAGWGRAASGERLGSLAGAARLAMPCVPRPFAATSSCKRDACGGLVLPAGGPQRTTSPPTHPTSQPTN